ncbi:MAG: signal peptidase II [Lacipirellulaceae bacterium]
MTGKTPPPPTAQTTGTPARRAAVFALIASVALALDLGTKAWVFSWPGTLTGKVYWVLPGYAGFQTSLNEGALFGMGQGRVGWFAVVSVVAAVAIPLWLFVGGAARDPWLNASLGGVMAGVLGNLYDRLGLHGMTWPDGAPRAGEAVYAVRDWVLVQAGDQLRWPNFNIADSLLVVGAAVLLLRALTEQPATTDHAVAQDAVEPEADADAS